MNRWKAVLALGGIIGLLLIGSAVVPGVAQEVADPAGGQTDSSGIDWAAVAAGLAPILATLLAALIKAWRDNRWVSLALQIVTQALEEAEPSAAKGVVDRPVKDAISEAMEATGEKPKLDSIINAAKGE